MIRKAMLLMGAVLSLLALPSALSAYAVSPLRIEIAPTGSNAVGRFVISNTDAIPATLSMKALRVVIAQDGTITREETSDLLVFPPQTVLQPGDTQALQVRFRGDPAMQAGLYTVHITQVPVNAVQGEQASLKVAVQFYTAVIVQAEGATGNLVLRESAPIPGTTRHRVTLVNEGDGFARLDIGALLAKGSAGSIPLAEADYAKGDTAYVMPGATRFVEVELGGNAASVPANGFTYDTGAGAGSEQV